MFEEERAFAFRHHDLPATVYMYVGEYEQVRPDDPHYASNKNNMVTDVETFARTLRGRHYPAFHLETEVLNGEDHLSVAPRGATHGLERLLSALPPAPAIP